MTKSDPEILFTNRQRIIDAFIFYNELDMLEYRLSIMYPYVDAFILVESTRTHKGTPKILYYQENKERYAKYADKIVHIVMDDLLENLVIDFSLGYEGEQWVNERHQRNGITYGIDTIADRMPGWKWKDDDVIFISDVDELVDTTKLDIICKALKTPEINGIIGFATDMYYYNLRHKHHEKWLKSKAITYSYYLTLSWVKHSHPQLMKVRDISRGVRLASCMCITEIFGWHLSCFGDAEMISNKLKEYGHQEFNLQTYTDVQNIREKMEKGVDFLGRNTVDIQKIELTENPYLPPFPLGIHSLSEAMHGTFPFCL